MDLTDAQIGRIARALDGDPVTGEVVQWLLRGDVEAAIDVTAGGCGRETAVAALREIQTDARLIELPAWNILVDCEEGGVPAFVKQLGARPHDWTEAGTIEHVPVNRPPFDDVRLVRRLKLRDRAGADPSEWDESLRVQDFPEAPR